MKNKVLTLTVFILIFFIGTVNIVYAGLGDPFDSQNILQDPSEVLFVDQFNKVWNTVLYTARIVAFLGVIFLGVRYIFSSSDKKAELKKSTTSVMIGIVVFFGSTFIIDFIKSIFLSL